MIDGNIKIILALRLWSIPTITFLLFLFNNENKSKFISPDIIYNFKFVINLITTNQTRKKAVTIKSLLPQKIDAINLQGYL